MINELSTIKRGSTVFVRVKVPSCCEAFACSSDASSPHHPKELPQDTSLDVREDAARSRQVQTSSKSVPSSAGHRFSKSPSRWSPRFNRAWIRSCVSGHVSAV